MIALLTELEGDNLMHRSSQERCDTVGTIRNSKSGAHHEVISFRWGFLGGGSVRIQRHCNGNTVVVHAYRLRSRSHIVLHTTQVVGQWAQHLGSFAARPSAKT